MIWYEEQTIEGFYRSKFWWLQSWYGQQFEKMKFEDFADWRLVFLLVDNQYEFMTIWFYPVKYWWFDIWDGFLKFFWTLDIHLRIFEVQCRFVPNKWSCNGHYQNYLTDFPFMIDFLRLLKIFWQFLNSLNTFLIISILQRIRIEFNEQFSSCIKHILLLMTADRQSLWDCKWSASHNLIELKIFEIIYPKMDR
jgi:hypothetical protein